MKNVKVEYSKGKGPGGQRKNKVETKVTLTHMPTGITVSIDGRERSKNEKEAYKILRQKLREHAEEERAKKKKESRDARIKNTKIIRTYNFVKGVVIDHRTGKHASLKEVLRKGRIDLLR
jgi:peptide chain release factor 1